MLGCERVVWSYLPLVHYLIDLGRIVATVPRVLFLQHSEHCPLDSCPPLPPGLLQTPAPPHDSPTPLLLPLHPDVAGGLGEDGGGEVLLVTGPGGAGQGLQAGQQAGEGQ